MSIFFDSYGFPSTKRSVYLHLLYVCLLFCFSILTGCNSKKEALPFSDELILDPYQEFTNSTLYFYNNNFIQWKLESQKMRKPVSDTGSIIMSPVRLTFFDSTGVVRTFVLADTGTIKNGTMDNYHVWGDVYIRTRDTMVIRSEHLRWYRDRRKVESDTFVQIETKKGDILRGKGLDATEDFSKFSFSSEVTGKFPNFRRRVESEEEDVF